MNHHFAGLINEHRRDLRRCSFVSRWALAGIVALRLWWPGMALGLDLQKSLFQFNCQNWTRQGGLPADKINSITQTKDGYVWLGSQNGLIRFDGVEFKVIPITLAQAQGHDGDIWACVNVKTRHFWHRAGDPTVYCGVPPGVEVLAALLKSDLAWRVTLGSKFENGSGEPHMGLHPD